MRTTLNIDDRLIRKAKQRALDRRTTLTRVIEEALAKDLADTDAPVPAFGLRLFPDAPAATVDLADRRTWGDVLDRNDPAPNGP